MRWMGQERALQSNVTSFVNLWSHEKDQAPTCCTLLDMLEEELILVMLQMKQKIETEMEQVTVFHTTLRLIKLSFLTQVFKSLLVLIIILFLMLDHRKSKRVSEKHLLLFYCFRKTSTSVLLIMPKPLTVFIYHNKLWEILQEMGLPDDLTFLLRNLYAGKEATVRNIHGTTDWFQIRKGVCQGCILSPCLFKLYAEYIMENARLDEAQGGIRIAWEKYQ